MKNKMEDIDQLIKETLTEEEAVFYDSLDEQNLFEMIGGLFQTKHRWMILLMNIIHVICIGLVVYCVIQFLSTDVTDELIFWAASGFAALAPAIMLKMFMWMQMNKNALLREMKRLELQVSSLAGKMSH